MTWPIDKLQTINDALALTGNNLVNVADDGSDEWTVASIGYESALPYAIESKDWKFATVVAKLNNGVGVQSPFSAGFSSGFGAGGNAPSDPLFTNAYDKPPDCLHLIWVRLNDQPVVYQILAGQIVLNNASSQTVTAKYVRAPTPDKVTPTFAMGLRAFVMSALYRGLNEEVGEADKMWAAGEQFLRMAAYRSDQEQPKRAMFNSRMAASRRIRRPWPPVPSGWGGSGVPG